MYKNIDSNKHFYLKKLTQNLSLKFDQYKISEKENIFVLLELHKYFLDMTID